MSDKIHVCSGLSVRNASNTTKRPGGMEPKKLPEMPEAFANAFAIERWSYDLVAREITLHGPILDQRNIPRVVPYDKDDLNGYGLLLRDWLETCKVGDVTTKIFPIRHDPLALRIFCAQRDDKTVGGFCQDVTNDVMEPEGSRRFRLALKGAAHGIALVALDGSWLQVNTALCEMLQYTEEELITLTFQDITHPDDLETDLDFLHECVAGKRNTYQMEKRYYRRDGKIIWVNLAVAILRAENDAPLYFISQIQDITAQKETESELIKARDEADRANKAKSSFLAAMSHEIRTPMTGVMGMLDILEGSGVSKEQLDLIQTARSSAGMLLSIINDVLDMAKLEAGKVEIASIDFDAEHIIRNVCDMMAAKAADKDLRFKATVALSARMWLQGDPNRISQILFNLLGNAVKFTQRGGVSLHVETRATTEGLSLVFDVEDTGPGISEDRLPTIFKEFEQLHEAGKQRSDGTGLGLAIVAKLVEAMRGKIDVTSKVGQGTRFTVTLPMKVGKSAIEEQPGRTHGSGSLVGRKVLVVEDNAVNRKVIQAVLDAIGIETTFAFDGFSAIDTATTNAFDAILMDVQMPGMDGMEATRQLRAAGLTLPIIGLTANAMSHDREACLEAGMDDHIGKPYRPDEIITSLTKFILGQAIS